MTSILVVVPAYGRSIKTDCAKSLMDLQHHLFIRRIPCNVEFVSVSDIVMARNYLASRLLEQPQFTHLLFIDSDMGIAPKVINNLIEADKPLIGAVCPYRSLSIERVMEFSKTYQIEQAIALASDFNIGFLKDGNGQRLLNVDRGIAKVAAIGMAVCLIHRSVFTSLVDTGKIRQTAANIGGRQISLHGFFDRMDNHDPPLLEDVAFCERWRSFCGGDVWAHVAAEITHVGDFEFNGSYLSRLRAGMP